MQIPHFFLQILKMPLLVIQSIRGRQLLTLHSETRLSLNKACRSQPQFWYNQTLSMLINAIAGLAAYDIRPRPTPNSYMRGPHSPSTQDLSDRNTLKLQCSPLVQPSDKPQHQQWIWNQSAHRPPTTKATRASVRESAQTAPWTPSTQAKKRSRLRPTSSRIFGNWWKRSKAS
jgi:hypothetical protein